MGPVGVKGQAPRGTSVVAGESLEALHSWNCAAYSDLVGQVTTGHELSAEEEPILCHLMTSSSILSFAY